MNYKKVFFQLFVVCMLLLTISFASAVSILLNDDFDSYGLGVIADIPDWYCSFIGWGGAPSYCTIQNIVLLEGTKTAKIDVVSNSGDRTRLNHDLPVTNSGIVRSFATVWIDHSNFDYTGSRTDYYNLELFDNSVVGFDFYRSQYPTFNIAGWSAVSSKTYVLEIILDYNTNTVYRYIFDEDFNLLHSVAPISFSGSATKKVYFEVISMGGSDRFAPMYVDDLYIYTGNEDPIVYNLFLTPENVTETQTLTCNYSFFDFDGDSDLSLIKWFRNSNLQSSYENSSTYPSSQFATGDVVTCSVTAYDGFDWGNTLSDTAIIGGFGYCGDGVCFGNETASSCAVDCATPIFCGDGFCNSGIGETINTCPEDCVTVQNITTDYSLTLQDSFNTGLSLYGADVYNFNLFYVGNNVDSKGVIGVNELVTPNTFGNDFSRVTGTQRYYDIDVFNGYVWTASDEMVQLWKNIFIPSRLMVTEPTNFSILNDVYHDVKAYNESLAFVCLKNSVGGYSLVMSIALNGSGELEQLDVYPSKCRSLEIDGVNDLLFVDADDGGSIVLNISNSSNMVLLDSYDFRASNFWAGRSDNLGLFNNVFFSDNGGRISYSFNASNPSNLVLSSSCYLPSSGDVFYSVEPYSEDLLLVASFLDDKIYLCNHSVGASGYATLLFDNNGFLPVSLVFETIGVHSYLYSATLEGVLQSFLFSTFNISNYMPTFIDGVLDSDLVDNLNPIALNVSPEGLESSIVNVDPLCRGLIGSCVFDVEGDSLLFAVDPSYNGSFTNPVFLNEYQYFSTSYDVVGLHTIRIYISDVEHDNVYTVFRDVVVDVSGVPSPLPENYSTLKFKVFDSDTGVVLQNVLVTVEGVGSSYTNVYGEVREVVPEGVYLVSFSLNGYHSKSNYFSTSTVQQVVNLEVVGVPNRRTLVLTIKDGVGGLVSDAFVQINTLITKSFDYKYSDASGKVIFYPREDNIHLTVDADGFGFFSSELSVPLGSIIYRDVVLTSDVFIGSNILSGVGAITGCQDYISNVIFCDYDGVNCTQDVECLSGLCSFNGHCSNFNWVLCDEQGIARGNRCIFKNVASGVLRGVGDWILDNFFYVLIIVLLLMAILIFALKNK